MELTFAPLFSGSSGNCVCVGTGAGRLLVDAGVSCARITAELARIGADARDILAILITHEHSDHIRGAGIFARKYEVPIYATAGTWAAMSGKLGELPSDFMRIIDSEQDFTLAGMNIQPFPTPHDAAESVGYSFTAGGATFALATDIGCARQGWLKRVTGAQAVLLESNYDPDMLRAGRYPYELKRRIMSKRGHLSNDDAAEIAQMLAEGGTRRIVLGHLSQENNFPDLALKCCETALEMSGAADCEVSVAERDRATGVFSLETEFT